MFFLVAIPVVHGAMCCHQKNKRLASVTEPPAPIQIPSNGNLTRVSRQSRSTTNDKTDNEVKPSAG